MLKISGLFFEGRTRPVVLLDGCARSEERVLLKAREEGVVDFGSAVFGRGAPYSEEEEAIIRIAVKILSSRKEWMMLLQLSRRVRLLREL